MFAQNPQLLVTRRHTQTQRPHTATRFELEFELGRSKSELWDFPNVTTVTGNNMVFFQCLPDSHICDAQQVPSCLCPMSAQQILSLVQQNQHNNQPLVLQRHDGQVVALPSEFWTVILIIACLLLEVTLRLSQCIPPPHHITHLLSLEQPGYMSYSMGIQNAFGMSLVYIKVHSHSSSKPFKRSVSSHHATF